MSKIEIIPASWPGLDKVIAFSTTRLSGYSEFGFGQLNLAKHVGDLSSSVDKNRKKLKCDLNLPNAPLWLNQIHGTNVIIEPKQDETQEGDASISYNRKTVCVVMTADCLPILLTNSNQTMVAAIHAGWRGMADGIIEKTISSINCNSGEIMAWMGPAISQSAFEVGNEVREIFINIDKKNKGCFQSNKNERWQADIYSLARIKLNSLGIKNIYGGEYCTMGNADLFFSFRRENKCGRMASIIYIK